MISNTVRSELKEAVPSWSELRRCRDKQRRLWRGTLWERQITTLPRKATRSLLLTAAALHGGRLKQTSRGIFEMCSFAANGSGCVENEMCGAEVARVGLSTDSCRDLSDSYECSFVCARGNIGLSRVCDMTVSYPPTGQGRRGVNVGARARSS